MVPGNDYNDSSSVITFATMNFFKNLGRFVEIYNVFRSAALRTNLKKFPSDFLASYKPQDLYQRALKERERANEVAQDFSRLQSDIAKFFKDPSFRGFSSAGKGDWFDPNSSKIEGYICKSKDGCPSIEDKCKEKKKEKKDICSCPPKCKKKEDPCKKKEDPCKKKEDPCKKKKEDPCKKKKEDPCKKKKEDPCKKKKEDPCKKKKKEDPCKKKEDPCKKKKEDPCKKKEDPCKKKKEDPCKKKEDPCKKKKEDPCKKKEDPCKKKKEDPCKKKDKKKDDPCAPKTPKKCEQSSQLCSQYPVINDPCPNPEMSDPKESSVKSTDESEHLANGDVDIFNHINVFDAEKLQACEEYSGDNYQNPHHHSFHKYAYYDLNPYMSESRNSQPSALPETTLDENECM